MSEVPGLTEEFIEDFDRKNSKEFLKKCSDPSLTAKTLVSVIELSSFAKTFGFLPTEKIKSVIQEVSLYSNSGKLFMECLDKLTDKDDDRTYLFEALLVGFLSSQMEVINLRMKAGNYIKEAEHWKDLLDLVCKEKLKEDLESDGA